MGNNNGKMGLPNISIGGSNLSRDVERKLQEASENGFDNHQLVLTNMWVPLYLDSLWMYLNVGS